MIEPRTPVVAGFIPASVGDKPRPYELIWQGANNEKAHTTTHLIWQGACSCPIHWAAMPDKSGNYEILGGIRSGIYPRLGRGQAPTLRCISFTIIRNDR